MKKTYVNISLKNDSILISYIELKDFEDDLTNRRVIIRQIINDNKLQKTIIPYESISYFEFTEMEV